MWKKDFAVGFTVGLCVIGAAALVGLVIFLF